MSAAISMLHREMYSMSQIDRLLGLTRGTASRWIDGYKQRNARHQPLVRPEQTGEQIATWGEFVEVRLISEYRRQGVPVLRMRPAIIELRREFRTDYPLATARPFTSVEGRELVLRIQQATHLRPSLSFVVRNQQAILPSLEVIRFQESAVYEGDEVVRFRLADHVTLDPEYASGEPTIAGRRLRVLDIAEAITRGDSRERIGELWDLTPAQIADAVRWSNIA